MPQINESGTFKEILTKYVEYIRGAAASKPEIEDSAIHGLNLKKMSTELFFDNLEGKPFDNQKLDISFLGGLYLNYLTDIDFKENIDKNLDKLSKIEFKERTSLLDFNTSYLKLDKNLNEFFLGESAFLDYDLLFNYFGEGVIVLYNIFILAEKEGKTTEAEDKERKTTEDKEREADSSEK